jgi:hypothetical protein
MKNGYHDHFCHKCGHGFICHKVTHCNESFETLCLDHKAQDFLESRADEHYRETGKWPGES